MSKLYFIPGSQDLYGEECLAQVAADCRKMVDFFNEEIDLYMPDSQFFEEKFNDYKRQYIRENGTASHQIHGCWRA